MELLHIPANRKFDDQIRFSLLILSDYADLN